MHSRIYLGQIKRFLNSFLTFDYVLYTVKRRVRNGVESGVVGVINRKKGVKWAEWTGQWGKGMERDLRDGREGAGSTVECKETNEIL